MVIAIAWLLNAISLHPARVETTQSAPQVLAGDLEPTTGEVIKSSKNVKVAFLRQEFVDELDPTVRAPGDPELSTGGCGCAPRFCSLIRPTD